MAFLLMFYIFVGVLSSIHNLEKIADINSKRLNAIEVGVEELKTLILQTKSAEEQGNFMTFTDLMKNYDIKRVFYPNEQFIDAIAYAKPVFTNMEAFEKFQDQFMKDAKFLEDLRKYFYTDVNSKTDLVAELRKILKNFFDGKFLKNNFTATKKSGTKLLLSCTIFGEALIGVFINKFKGKQESMIRKAQVLQFTIDEAQIWKWVGHICLNADSWGKGRQERGSKKAFAEQVDNENED